MQLGMIGLGRMGANMVRRLLRGSQQCVVFDLSPQAVGALAAEGATGASSMAEFARLLAPPRAIWLMVPAAAVDATLASLLPHLSPGDTLIDGGNSWYVDDLRRAEELKARGLHFIDVGTSGGVWGLDRGYCLMIGGETAAVARLEPVFRALAPGPAGVARAGGADKRAPDAGDKRASGDHAFPGSATQGYLHCGPAGAGHFVKMVHNGIEYGMMAAYAEGFGILQNANVGAETHEVSAESTPLMHPEHYRYDFDVAGIAEVWRRGSVIASWLLDVTAGELAQDPALATYAGRVSDSGEGRWTLKAAIDEAVPAPVLGAALFARFSSRGMADFQQRMLSAMRHGFGGHAEQHAGAAPNSGAAPTGGGNKGKG